MARLVARLVFLFSLFAAPALAQRPVPFFHLIAANQFCIGGDGPICVTRRFGANPAVPTMTAALLTQTGSDHALIFVNTTFSVASTDANDAAAGSGTRTVRVQCFDEDFLLFEETVELDGTAEVAMATPCMLPVRLIAATGGTENSANVGTIWIGTGAFTGGVPAVKHGQIIAGKGQSEISLYASRQGYKICVVHVTIGTDDLAEIYFYTLSKASGYVRRAIVHLMAPEGLHTINRDRRPSCFDPEQILLVEGMSLSGGSDAITISYDIFEYRLTPDGKIDTAPIQ